MTPIKLIGLVPYYETCRVYLGGDMHIPAINNIYPKSDGRDGQ